MRRISPEWVLVLVTLLAACGWIFSKQALRELDPYTFVASRFSLAGLVLALLCRKELVSLTGRAFLTAVMTGVVFGLSLMLWIQALDRTDSVGEGAFIVSLSVVIVPLVSRVFFADSIHPRLLYALPFAVSGLALLSLQNGFRLDANQTLFLIATTGFAMHLILSSRYAVSIAPPALASIQLLVVGLLCSGVAWSLEPQFTRLLGFDLKLAGSTWLWFLCSALIATSLRFLLQTMALARVSASHASMIFVLEPIWTFVLGALVLNERMAFSQLAGCGLILAALVTYRAVWLQVFWRRLWPDRGMR